MNLIKVLIPILIILFSCDTNRDKKEGNDSDGNLGETGAITPAAEQFNEYLPLIKDKTIAIVTNHTAMLGETHLVDSLHSLGISIKMVFAPEHGFRGDADAGEKVEDGKDPGTGIPIISLYGETRKPSAEMLDGVDILIFDIQDVGARFYTYITTMHHAMEAAAENNVPFLVLDRPNPNGNYVDGPIRNDSLQSFVGMHPIPIAHGLTVGELASMINGEEWLPNNMKCDLTVIKTANYKHSDTYVLPVKPSPNLPTQLSVILYPTVCLFEGTAISVGRGTYKAFQQIGHPSLKGKYEFSFTPISIDGMAKNPKYKDEECFGINFEEIEVSREFTLKYLIEMYNAFDDKENFFNNYIHKLEGSGLLKEQIMSGMTEDEIRKTWEPALSEYKEMRKKYLLYDLE